MVQIVKLWLDGGFWGPWIRREFVAEIEWSRKSILEFMLPSLPEPSSEADAARERAWQEVMSRPSDGSGDPGDFVDWADAQGYEVYKRLTNVSQATLNMATVMLWHLVEQQMLLFHARQVLAIGEEQQVRDDPAHPKTLFKLEEFHRRLDDGGCSMKALNHWPKVEELRNVANSVKHGPGRSLNALADARPDLLERETGLTLVSARPPWVDRPAGGEDLFVSTSDLESYYDATKELWIEFSHAIETHSARSRS